MPKSKHVEAMRFAGKRLLELVEHDPRISDARLSQLVLDELILKYPEIPKGQLELIIARLLEDEE